MIKKTMKLFITFAVTSILCLGAVVGCGTKNEAQNTYTIQVMSEGGKALSDIKVYVYKDSKQENLVWAATTDEDGKVTFEAEASEAYVAVLQGVPDGYQAEDTYPVQNEQTEIKLKTILIDDTDSQEVIYELGDVIQDFEVVAIDGNTYKLSELLKEKKAVVLNFWFLNCGPCKMEFPYMQQAYEEYKDKIEVIAINPVDGTNDNILAYAQENGLTFPMAAGDVKWQTAMTLEAYPTTVVIDRYGTIAMIHKGSITEKETFIKIFEYFTSDDYEQTTLRSINDIK